uniref:Odorant receptor, family 63, subfamily B, member 1 n=1 Tax=Astyanax mexicanus TaxID=7994 RepID=A0A3B1JEU8_ASTMX
MSNSTRYTTIVLAGYMDVGEIKYLYFTILLLLYITIILANSLLIGVISVERTLHEPMYMFLCSLSVNELYGSAAFFPAILTHMLSKSHEVPIAHCYVQIFSLYTYASVELGNLAIMSYDRYTAICYPLLYSSIMTDTRVYTLIGLVWLISIMCKVWCDNYLIVKLACSDTTVSNIYGTVGSIISILVPLLLIIYSYIQIWRACLTSSAETTQKAILTCTPHIASLLNFSFGCSFEMFSSRFNKVYMPPVLRVIISVYFVICPPLLNPIMYGIRLTKIKMAFKTKINHS